MTNASKRLLLISLASGCLSLSLIGCGPDSPGTFSGTQTGGSQIPASGNGSYPVRITSEIPAGAVQLRVSGADVEGDPVQSTTQAAETSVIVNLDPSVSTLRLDYLDSGGLVVATFVESAKNLLEHDFRGGITDPALVSVGGPRVQAKGDNPVVGSDIKFSFAFLGCNRAIPEYDDRADFRDQLNQPEKDATANVAQLRQHFEDVKSLDPKPKFIFLCGDVIQKPKIDQVADSKAILEKEMKSWHKIRAYGPVIIDSNGVRQQVTPPAEGSLFPNDVTVVVMPGNHEMCYRKVNDSQELPNKVSGAAFVAEMASFIRGSNGPQPGAEIDDGGLNFPADNVQRDESKLSYTFRADATGSIKQDGEYFFMVLNTDTYVGDGLQDVAHIPLRWIRKELSAAQQDASVKHIFVFGHRPVQSVYSEFGINPGNDQAKMFYRLLNNPTAQTPAELKVANLNTKVRGYFCAHAHLMSTVQPDPNGTVQQLVCGSGGSEPDPTNVEGVSPYPWFGFGLVGVNMDEAVNAAFIGRNVHTSTSATRGHWSEQEPMKQRGPNISGPGLKEAKTPKMVRRLYPQLRTVPGYLQSVPTARYTSTFESNFSDHSAWNIETFGDYPRSDTEYKQENVEYLSGGGVRLKVSGKRLSKSNKVWLTQSGRLRSEFRQKYGLFLYRAKVPKGQHLWPALWTAGVVDGANAWPLKGEIDVMETVLDTNSRNDFTSRMMVRADQPNFPDYSRTWFASMPPDDSGEIKTPLTAEQWAQPHIFAVDWYKVLTGQTLTDVRYDFYMDVKVNEQGRLVNALDESKPPTRLQSYSLTDLIKAQNTNHSPKVPDLTTLESEWGKQAFVLNVAVGGGWDSKFEDLKQGRWDPPSDGSADMVVDWVKCYQRAVDTP